jgi:antitoxin HigA-1
VRLKKLPPIHPGEILQEDYLKPLGLTAHRLATALRVPATGIAEVIHERRAITADTAIRLGRYFNTPPVLAEIFKTAYDLEVAEDRIGARIRSEVQPAGAKLSA